jgi:membrane protein implicated in regulation of membrane protease activity
MRAILRGEGLIAVLIAAAILIVEPGLAVAGLLALVLLLVLLATALGSRIRERRRPAPRPRVPMGRPRRR